MDHKQLEAVIHEEIPVTSAMQVSVVSASIESVTLSMKLLPNMNHKSTAFGGSLYVLTVLTGWAYLFNRLSDLGVNAHIVIQHGDIRYHAPVTDDFVANCEAPDEQQFEKFMRTFNRLGKARINLPVVIKQRGENAVSFNGSYVIHR